MNREQRRAAEWREGFRAGRIDALNGTDVRESFESEFPEAFRAGWQEGFEAGSDR
jgi:hypothetical protein